MNYLRSRSLKRLLSLGRRSNADEPIVEECVDVEPPPPPPPTTNKPTWRCFSYDELHQATNGFHQDNVVGKGGYGEVYRGALDDGRAVAVKRLAPTAAADEKKEKDFLTELGTVGHVRHPNVSALLGCCVDRGLHLVFEFSAQGSVSANLHDEKLPVMSWKRRHGIAVGTARGLRYLHKGCARRIIHRDIKASNILLTEDYEPQVIDLLSQSARPPLCSWRQSVNRRADFGFRPRPVAAVGVDAPRHRAHRGHVRVPGAGVLHARHRGREDGRVRVRRLPPRAHLRAEAGGRFPQQPHRLGQAVPDRRRRPRARGPAARRQLRRRADEAAHVRRVALRQGRRGVAADHDPSTGAIRVR